jgi:phosphoribosylcarboxyaminoimidazole (NCAIR) mutase
MVQEADQVAAMAGAAAHLAVVPRADRPAATIGAPVAEALPALAEVISTMTSMTTYRFDR